MSKPSGGGSGQLPFQDLMDQMRANSEAMAERFREMAESLKVTFATFGAQSRTVATPAGVGFKGPDIARMVSAIKSAVQGGLDAASIKLAGAASDLMKSASVLANAPSAAARKVTARIGSTGAMLKAFTQRFRAGARQQFASVAKVIKRTTASARAYAANIKRAYKNPALGFRIASRVAAKGAKQGGMGQVAATFAATGLKLAASLKVFQASFGVLMKAARMGTEKAEGANAANSRLAAYSPTLAMAFAKLAVGDMRRSVELSLATQRSATTLALSVDKMRDAWQGFNEFKSELSNRIGSFSAGFSQTIGNTASWISKLGTNVLNTIDPDGSRSNALGKLTAIGGGAVVGAGVGLALTGGNPIGAAIGALTGAFVTWWKSDLGKEKMKEYQNMWVSELARKAQAAPLNPNRPVPKFETF